MGIVLLHIVHSIPYDLDAFSVRNSIVDAIASKYDEVMLILNLKGFALSRDHKPLDEFEEKRVIEAGGRIYSR